MDLSNRNALVLGKYKTCRRTTLLVSKTDGIRHVLLKQLPGTNICRETSPKTHTLLGVQVMMLKQYSWICSQMPNFLCPKYANHRHGKPQWEYLPVEWARHHKLSTTKFRARHYYES